MNEDCKAWLRELLADGPMKVNAIYRHGERAGFSADMIRRARIAIGAVRRKLDHPQRGKGKWVWELIDSDEQLSVALQDLRIMRRRIDRLEKRIETALAEPRANPLLAGSMRARIPGCPKSGMSRSCKLLSGN